MRIRRNLGLITGLALALSLVAGAALSLAHTKKNESTVTIRFVEGGTGEYSDPDKFAGKVKSDKERCIRGRTVKVFREAEYTVEKIGTDTTNRRGRWKLEVPDAEEGDYFAKATREFLKRSGGHRHVCRKAQSKTVTVGEYEYTGPGS